VTQERLLEHVEVRQLYDACSSTWEQTPGAHPRLVLGKAPAGARPHYSFHVVDVHSITCQVISYQCSNNSATGPECWLVVTNVDR